MGQILRKYSFTVIALMLLSLFLFLVDHQEKLAMQQIYDGAVESKKSFLKDSVNNFIVDIDATVEDCITVFGYTIEDNAVLLDQYISRNGSSLQNLIDFFSTNKEFYKMWGFVLMDKNDGSFIGSFNAMDDWDGDINKLREYIAVYKTVEIPSGILYYGVTQIHMYNTVEEIVRARVYRSRFDNDSYIWINRDVDYDGGDDYAIRAIHPLLKESEGSYLSTKMHGAYGARPYLAELEGIKSNGETFNSYYFKRGDSDEVAYKLSYSKLYEPYDWIVSMGAYYDDIVGYDLNGKKTPLSNASRYAIPLSVVIMVVIILALLFQISAEHKRINARAEGFEKKANWDELTHANSRLFGIEELNHCFMNFKNGLPGPAIMLMDVDNFKTINDTYGHSVGDKVLQAVVDCAYQNSRVSDKIIRWGGDEFIGIFDGMKLDYCHSFAKKMLEAVRNIEIVTETSKVHVTVSIGFSYFKNADLSYKEVIDRADLALYDSKHKGKNAMSIHM